MLDAKIQLAKLLATEDITVRHSQTAKTASFDVVNRVLTLPNWITEYSDILDMMTGHEVGHAIWTLKEDWERALKELNLHKGITNVVEDARIEKKIKRKYPGLVKSFHTGYKALENKNFFYNSPEELEDFNLIDRINLHCKMGDLRYIDFNDFEIPYVEMVEQVETWADVERVTLILMDLMKMESEKQESALMDSDDDSEGRGSSMDSGSDGDSDDGGSQDRPVTDVDGDMTDMLDADGKLFDDIVKSQENFDRNVSERLTEKDKRYNEVRYFTLPEPNMKNVLIPYKRVISELGRQVNKLDKEYILVQNGNSVDGRQIDRFKATAAGCVGESACSIDYLKFRRDAVKIVGYMAKEFERKKSAREYRKESISKTGVLDMSKIFSYKYNDDLFLRNTLRPDGKNHGVMMMVDWSASMSSHMFDTLKQVMSLVWFCQKVNIPFEVYAFSSAYSNVWERRNGMPWDEFDAKVKSNDWHSWNIKGNNVNFGHDNGLDSFNLFQLFSSKMNAKDVTKMMKLIFRYGWGHEWRFEKWEDYDLGSTPTLPALVALNKMIPAFRKHYKLDICNLIILTDGQGNNSFGSINGLNFDEGFISDNVDCRLEDPVTKKQYRLKSYGNRNSKYIEKTLVQERAVLALLKDRYDINIIGLFLDGGSNGRTVRQHTLELFLGWKYYNKEKFLKARQEIKKNGMASLPWMCYDEFYLVPVGKLRDMSGELDIDGTMTVGKIKNAFKKNQNAKFGNKVLVNKMMDVMA